MYSNHLRNNMSKKLSSFDSNPIIEVKEKLEQEVEDSSIVSTESSDSPKIVNSFETPPQVVETVAADAASDIAVREFSMQLPCEGEIISDCSVNELVYCSTMDDWRTHNGLDIAGAIGTQVKAAESGTVSQVYSDELMGVVVVIDHGADISSLYSNLQSQDFITVGTEVKKGDVIGGIGQCGALEANAEPHLHFEVIANDEYRHPMDFIK